MLMTEQAAILSELLDDILCRWQAWVPKMHITRYYASKAAGCEDYRPSRQHDMENGALDQDTESLTMAVVNGQIEALESMHRYAIIQEARTCTHGIEVFIHPRLPKDRQIRHNLIKEARSFLTRRLQNAGVL